MKRIFALVLSLALLLSAGRWLMSRQKLVLASPLNGWGLPPTKGGYSSMASGAAVAYVECAPSSSPGA